MAMPDDSFLDGKNWRKDRYKGAEDPEPAAQGTLNANPVPERPTRRKRRPRRDF